MILVMSLLFRQFLIENKFQTHDSLVKLFFPITVAKVRQILDLFLTEIYSVILNVIGIR
jgi:hypothetical protein